jgi:hypothetical protein
MMDDEEICYDDAKDYFLDASLPVDEKEEVLDEYFFDHLKDCQETSTRDTANKRSLELCAPIVLVLLEDGCGKWCFLPGQVVSNWYH